jgi:protein-S-isoprenylcysteine O-methyltransferase Ste14
MECKLALKDMRRPSAIFGSLIFLVIAPGFVAGVFPWWITGWVFRSPLLGFYLFRAMGVALIALGLPVLLDSFARFAVQGLGTPAPVLPTKHLVVTGLYRFVRNPMYVAVCAIIFGQAFLFGSVQLLIYGALIWLAFHLFVLLYEEPKLRSSFDSDYVIFCQHVPRWIPRMTPWHS